MIIEVNEVYSLTAKVMLAPCWYAIIFFFAYLYMCVTVTEQKTADDIDTEIEADC